MLSRYSIYCCFFGGEYLILLFYWLFDSSGGSKKQGFNRIGVSFETKYLWSLLFKAYLLKIVITSFRSRCNLCQAKKKIQRSNSTGGKLCTGRYLLVDNGDHSNFFFRINVSLTFVKLISLQAEYPKVTPKITICFVFWYFFLNTFGCLSELNLLCCGIVFLWRTCNYLAFLLENFTFTCKNYLKITLTSSKCFLLIIIFFQNLGNVTSLGNSSHYTSKLGNCLLFFWSCQVFY